MSETIKITAIPTRLKGVLFVEQSSDPKLNGRAMFSEDSVYERIRKLEDEFEVFKKSFLENEKTREKCSACEGQFQDCETCPLCKVYEEKLLDPEKAEEKGDE